MGKAKITGKIEGAERAASNAGRLARGLSSDLDKAVDQVGDAAVETYQDHAPHKSGTLRRGISKVVAGDVIYVKAVARDPDSGYDYVAVSRFGHKRKVIKPVRSRGRARRARSVTRTPGGQFAKRAPGALKFSDSGGIPIFRHSVRGFHPAGDWAEGAQPDVDALAQEATERLGRAVAVRWAA